MNFEELYSQLIEDFELENLPKEEQKEMLEAVAKTLQKQFLLDIYDEIGEKQFEALQASAQMGEDFYATTLKHIVPNYEEVFQKSRRKVVETFKRK
jgi:hypothetical protein